MFKILRMVCAVIAAAAVVACVFLGIYLGIVAFWCGAAAALLFFALCMLFKYLQEEKEGKAEEGALSVAARLKESGSSGSAKKGAGENESGAPENNASGGDSAKEGPRAESGPHGENGAAGGFEKGGVPGGASGKKKVKNSKK